MTKTTTKTTNKFLSRKFIVALILILIEVLRGFGLELPESSAGIIQTVAISYISGQSFGDAVVAYKTKQ